MEDPLLEFFRKFFDQSVQENFIRNLKNIVQDESLTVQKILHTPNVTSECVLASTRFAETSLNQFYEIRDLAGLEIYAEENSSRIKQAIEICKASPHLNMSLHDFIEFMIYNGRVAWLDIVKLIQSEETPLFSPIAKAPSPNQTSTFSRFYGPTEYSNDHGILNIFSNYIDRCFQSYKDLSGSYYSSYLVLCQSSGSGKTRLCIESSKIFLVFYICGRSQGSTGELGKSSVIADYIKDATKPDVCFWSSLIYSILYVCYFDLNLPVEDNKFHNLLKDSLFNEEVQRSFWTSVIELHREFMKVLLPIIFTDRYEQLEQYISSWFSVLNQQLTKFASSKNLPSLLGNIIANKSTELPLAATRFLYEKLNSKRGVKSLLVIDEASFFFLTGGEAKNPEFSFLHFRRALRCIDIKYFSFFAVLLDTNSRVANFPPEISQDRSSRVAKAGNELFSPFHLLPKELQIFKKPPPQIAVSITFVIDRDTRVLIKYKLNPFLLAVLSRALFAAIAYDICQLKALNKVQLQEALFSRVVLLAMQKLVNSRLDVESLRNKTSLFALASSRFYLSSTTQVLQEDLVKQHMATLLDISLTRDRFKVSYPSEPLIAEASLQCLLFYYEFEGHKRSIYYDLLNCLKDMLSTDILVTTGGKGEIGELLSCIVLSRLYDIASLLMWRVLWEDKKERSLIENLLPIGTQSKHIFTRPIPLLFMFKLLFPSNYLMIVDMIKTHYKPEFMYAVVQFNHFIKVEYTVSREHLPFYLQRSAAIVCANGEAGVDVAIPIAIPTNIDHNIDFTDVSTYQPSTFLIDSKNWKNNYNLEDLATKISNSSLVKSIGFDQQSPDQLFLILNVGEGSCSEEYFGQDAVAMDVSISTELTKDNVTFTLGGTSRSTIETRSQTLQAEEQKHTRKVIVCQKYNLSEDNFTFFLPEEMKILQHIQSMDPWRPNIIKQLESIGLQPPQIKALMNNQDNGKNPPF